MASPDNSAFFASALFADFFADASQYHSVCLASAFAVCRRQLQGLIPFFRFCITKQASQFGHNSGDLCLPRRVCHPNFEMKIQRIDNTFPIINRKFVTTGYRRTRLKRNFQIRSLHFFLSGITKKAPKNGRFSSSISEENVPNLRFSNNLIDHRTESENRMEKDIVSKK